MADNLVPINPKDPQIGNLKGTFAGFVAMLAAGWMSSQGIFESVSHLISSDPVMCGQIENSLFVLMVATVGSIVNYAATHFAQVKKLQALYDMLPNTYSEYPNKSP